MRLMVCPRLGVSLYRKAPVTHFVSLRTPYLCEVEATHFWEF